MKNKKLKQTQTLFRCPKREQTVHKTRDQIAKKHFQVLKICLYKTIDMVLKKVIIVMIIKSKTYQNIRK